MVALTVTSFWSQVGEADGVADGLADAVDPDWAVPSPCLEGSVVEGPWAEGPWAEGPWVESWADEACWALPRRLVSVATPPAIRPRTSSSATPAKSRRRRYTAGLGLRPARGAALFRAALFRAVLFRAVLFRAADFCAADFGDRFRPAPEFGVSCLPILLG